ncbi:MAG TPA: 16S rRNA (guanine(966)-N(2))-methyltransferase RsmD [Streptosporangiaceae bacterium]|nr:16S rRNA (guanine(966)-N(2))-methyltransferase RsmD [Streptosporangiaceae bacterium]
MRVIAGTAKGRTLRSPRMAGTRPITDRAKESLFSILTPRILGSSFLDLFAGTGGVGIEALSRGAGHATFVESAASALADIRHNLDATHLATRAEVIGADVFAYLRRHPAPFDVIFVAPPQWRGLWTRAVRLLDQRPGWLAPDGLVVVQHDPSETAGVPLQHLRAASERTYGRVRFTFFGHSQPGEPGLAGQVQQPGSAGQDQRPGSAGQVSGPAPPGAAGRARPGSRTG